jgi:hypothetical protein
MTSARKVRTNRANARASSGPKTSAGRARSARNALRHGLNVPIADLEVFSPEVERLAEAIGGTQPGDAQLERHVRLVAEAQIDMLRVRQARDRFLADKLGQKRLPKALDGSSKKRAAAPKPARSNDRNSFLPGFN